MNKDEMDKLIGALEEQDMIEKNIDKMIKLLEGLDGILQKREKRTLD